MYINMYGFLRIVCILGLYLRAPILVSGTYTYANETALRAFLKTGYDTTVRPTFPTIVDMNYNMRFMSSLDITGQAMSHLGWFEFYYTDPRLTWDPADYSNITVIDIDWAWRPVFAINGINEVLRVGYTNDDIRVLVNYQGKVKYFHDLVVDTPCEIHVQKFPFDEQTCEIDLTFKEHDYWNALELNFESEVRTGANYLINGEWEFRSSSMKIIIHSFVDPYPTNLGMVQIFFTFKRLKEFYVINLILPTMFLSLCMVWAFIIPTECGERLGYSLTILLSYTVVLTITADMLPTTSQEVPYIATYLLVILVLCTMIVCNVGLHIKLYFKEETPPIFIQKIYKRLKPIVFLELCPSTKISPAEHIDTNKEMKLEEYETKKCEHFGSDIESEPEIVQVTYKDISIFLDRLCLYVYSVAVSVCAAWLVVELMF